MAVQEFFLTSILPSSGLLHGIRWFETNMSKKDSLTLEYGSDRLFFVISQKMEE
jgi:hypothetical protein